MSEPAYPLTFPESGPSWPAQGSWTYEDYLRLPDDGRRYEVIRGVLYAAGTPGYDHQYAVTQLICLPRESVGSLGILLPGPFEILLPGGLGDPVQPDLVFISRDRLPHWGAQNFQGTPDIVIEVFSHESETFDRTTKLTAYRDAGVPEVWLVDPITRTVEVFGLPAERSEYVLRERQGAGETVGSAVLPDLRIEVAELFPSDEHSL